MFIDDYIIKIMNTSVVMIVLNEMSIELVVMVVGGGPVNEIPAFEVGHGGGDLGGHVQQDDGVDLFAIGPAQIVEQIAARHELGHDVERRLPRAHPQQLHQIRVFHFLPFSTFFIN